MRELATAGVRALTGALLALTLAAAPAVAATGPVITRPVAFVVHNTNRTPVPCTANGATYQVRGQLVGPARALDTGGGPATLYLHGLGFGVFFWNFSAVPGYDFAASLGELGHVSVIIDRLRYGASDHPPGSASCIGSQADVAHQIIQQLRAGTYRVGNGPPVAFGRVALVVILPGALSPRSRATRSMTSARSESCPTPTRGSRPWRSRRLAWRGWPA